MINKDTIEEIKAHLNEYLEEKGIKTRGLFTCLNPQHDDKNPSMSYNDKLNNVKCFSCNTSYDIFNLYALDNNLDVKKDFKEIVEALALKYGIKITSSEAKKTNTYNSSLNAKKEDYTKYYNKCKKDISDTDYLLKRGISEDIIAKYGIGYDKKEKRVIFPLNANSYIARSTEENPVIKHYKPKGSNNVIFNEDYIKQSDFKSVVWVNEAIIDALSLETINEDIKAVSLNSINNAKQLVELARDNNYKGVFVLALDTDTQGLRASQELKEDLETIGVKAYIFNRNNDSYNISSSDEATISNKDINEYLLTGKDRLKNNADHFNNTITEILEKEALKTYQQENVLNYLDKFNEFIKDSEKNKPISTGILELDKALDGGFYKKNLVILGAISSLGKTTLALQIADNMARDNNDVLIFSLEMAKEELIAKSLSRLSFLKAYDKHYTALALTTREVMTGKGTDENLPNQKERRENYNEAYEDYKENQAKQIYITECNEALDIDIKAIDDKIKKHIAITGNKPLVIIDYLQIIQDSDKYLSDKQKVDKILTNLKRIARENDITILLISSLNRGAYTQEINLDSFKDSGNIEYTADVLLGLQLETDININDEKIEKKVKEQINKGQQKEERKLTLKVLKNRNGRITDIKGVVFYAKYNYMDFKSSETPKF